MGRAYARLAPFILMGAVATLAVGAWAAERPPEMSAPATMLTAQNLGLIINELDPLSVQIGDYYQRRRGIPARNVVRLRFAPEAVLGAKEFARLKAVVDQSLTPDVQALALAWAKPFRVECMSVTSAFAYGFDVQSCATGCRPTPRSLYFNSGSRAPYSELGIRPAMSLAATDLEHARALIDRGVASDGTFPDGTAYLMDTSDAARNARAPSFRFAEELAGEGLEVSIIKADAIQGRQDVLFYFTGLAKVVDLATNRFLPGAMADHLTSTGGVLFGSGQMSSLRWLEAGATGSYGTVVEPCAFPTKFPDVPIAMRRYLAGETLIEAYWKSVAMPSQGLFIGEPLARPFGVRPDTEER